MVNKPSLSREDQARVDDYLQSANHQIRRQAFKPWLLLGVIIGSIVCLSVLSYGIAYLNGAIY